MNVDEIKVGGYQLLMLLLLSVNLVIVGMSHALSIFYKYRPDFHCQDDDGNDAMNRTSICTTSTSLSSCTFEDGNRTSVASDWLLICHRESLLRTSADVYFGGMLLGAIVAGLLMDRIGRMPILAICLYAQGTMAVALNIAKYYQLFLVFRGLQGFFMQGLESSTYILGIELFPSKYRTPISLLMLSMRSIGFITLAGLSYVILDWRVLQLVVSIPTLLTVLYIWLIPESARWLIARERQNDAEMVIRKIDDYNNLFKPGKEVPQKPKRNIRSNDDECDVGKSTEEAENLLEQTVNVEIAKATNEQFKEDLDEVEKAEMTDDVITSLDAPENMLASEETLSTEVVDANDREKMKSSFIARFFETRFIGRTCLILMCLWFSCSLVFHGLITLPPRMKVDRHVSLVIAGAVEIVTFLFGCALISSRLGRRTPLCVSQIIAGSVCVAVAVLTIMTLSQQTMESIAHGKMAILKIGAIANITCFFILRILTVELFPTISRGTGLGLCIAAEMFGGLVSPFVLMLNNYLTEQKLDISRIAIGVLCICVAISILFLRETVNLYSLPDTVEDAKMSCHKGNNEKCNNEEVGNNKQSENPEKLRKKLFSEDWVDAGNGIIVNFTENKTVD